MNTQLSFYDALKSWRKSRKMSQLDLAIEADVSQRHVSWLETGRAKPSREMVIKLAETLDIPHRERNRLLDLAGYAPLYRESQLDEPAMQMVRDVLQQMLENHDPYPAIVMDRFWNLKMKNSAADRMFSLLGDPYELSSAIGCKDELNIAVLSMHPKGLRQFIQNFDDISLPFYYRLKRDALATKDEAVISLIESLSQYLPEQLHDDISSGPLPPILPLQYSFAGVQLNLISVLSSFGSAQDVTARELQIETFYPADETTKRYFKQLQM